MANYAASVLAKGQAKLSAKFQAPELRAQMPTVLAMALKNQDYSIPNAAKLRTSPLRPVDVNFFKNIAPGTGTAKAALHTGTIADSNVVNLSYVQVVETFSLPAKLSDNSIYEQQDIFNNQYEQAIRNIRTRLDIAALAYLYAHRCQLSAAVMNGRTASFGPGSWDGVNFALPIDNSKQKVFMQQAKLFMAANNYTGPYDMVADLQTSGNFEFEKNQGSSNANNFSFQFGDADIYTTQQLIDAAFGAGATLMMPRGTFAGLNWNEALNRRGYGSMVPSTLGMVGTQLDPMGSGLELDVSWYTGRADTSANATGGSTQDFVDQWEFTGTVGFATPPLSLAGDSAVIEIAQGS
ncbi:MAG: hypothetical protein JWR05_3486 [Mucilaginibacter sp.]|nr:hypothetical protein [Mucilaginibacter sp.]